MPVVHIMYMFAHGPYVLLASFPVSPSFAELFTRDLWPAAREKRRESLLDLLTCAIKELTPLYAS